MAVKYPHQRKLALELGATNVVPPRELVHGVRFITRSLMQGNRLRGGADVVFDCVGNSGSLRSALDIVKPGGRIVLLGMPGTVTVPLAALWQREVELVGSYCYSHDQSESDFDTAISLVANADLGRLVTSLYPITRYREALQHAAEAGARGGIKVVFDLEAHRRKHFT